MRVQGRAALSVRPAHSPGRHTDPAKGVWTWLAARCMLTRRCGVRSMTMPSPNCATTRDGLPGRAWP